MEARTSASSYDCQSGRLKNEKSVLCTDNAVSKLSFTPVAKSPMCWPGAVMQSDHGYYTPRRGSVVCHPRTPYSGALFSKSTSKVYYVLLKYLLIIRLILDFNPCLHEFCNVPSLPFLSVAS